MPLIKSVIDPKSENALTPIKTRATSFEHSASKICLRQTSLTESLSWAHYQNEHDRLYYANKQQHTLSLYLSGGYETHRTDVSAGFGAPGKFCLMPKDSESHWQLGQTQQFMHLYFTDDYLKQLALKVFDIDPRMLQLPELTFTNDVATEALFRHCMATSDWANDHLAMEQVTNTILVSMLQNMGITRTTAPIKGGLSPKVATLVCDFMQANFHRQIYLAELATLAQLSEYHFCRMFKQSHAQTPQAYLLAIRIEQVKLRLCAKLESVSEIALQCGFANQSHMGRYFKKLVGISPSQYRSLSRN
ncbi:helix-turn-helix domain-containing protein [Psychromonas sp. Urea-02u-13]|uniref:helix-turn-helix domain-containing protein n=1 Tax=Psychromonas sp. Urea-02u-13 TaxID=2058326 RepID=UPI000C32CEBF|nr:AraC family transcriptional regulator [Psychromonas sp. Urea-02u-13]PKG39039.1 AraC family transcriptional regulator [Psychromonas sp. Urea-02u-13]